ARRARAGRRTRSRGARRRHRPDDVAAHPRRAHAHRPHRARARRGPGASPHGGAMTPSDPAAGTVRGRHETKDERSDRNWGELLQELRVTQTGAQILTGFLLTVPFQSRFTELDDVQVTAYL